MKQENFKVNSEYDKDIKEYLKNVKLNHKFNGIDEKDFWVLLSNIQKFYQRKYEALKSGYQIAIKEKDALLESLAAAQGSKVLKKEVLPPVEETEHQE